MKKKIRWIAVFLMVSCSIIVGVRIYYVNASAKKPGYEYYSIGEWVDYNGAGQIGINENTKGYYAKVVDATFMTYKEYMQKYDFPLDTLPNLYSETLKGLEVNDIYNIGVIDVEMEFRNDSSTDGHIALSESKIFASTDNVYYTICEPVLDLQEPKLAGGMGYFFTLKPNGEAVTMNVPYILPIYSDGHIGQETGDFPKHLTITQVPIRKMVEIPFRRGR